MSKDTLIMLQQGELELRKVFEETTTKNVRTIVDYTTQTRTMFRDVEERMLKLEKKIVDQNQQINNLLQQVSILRSQLYKPGD